MNGRESSAKGGFTLIELMIAVAIVGILGMVALPSYKKNLRQSQRANAQAVMLDCTQKLERYYSQSMSYSSATVANVGGTGTCVLTNQGHAISGGTIYTFTLTPAAASYTLVAVPSADQSADACGTLCVDNTGMKVAGSASGSGATCAALIPSNTASCW